MQIENVGFIGWRGMVGSVLLDRMRAEGDFKGLVPEFYTTSQVGDAAPDVGCEAPPLKDAYDLAALARHDAIVTCQGGDYTKQVLHDLRKNGWTGYWIDAARFKRMAQRLACIGDVRGLGGMVAIELFKDKDCKQPDAELTKAVVVKAAEQGLILLSCGTYANVIRVLVPLTASNAEVDEGLDIIEQSLDALASVENAA